MDNISQIAEIKTKELLSNLSINFSEISVDLNQDTKILNIGIKGDELGILIGFHGKNLDSLKNILALIINKNIERDNSVRVIVNINDYTEKRAEQLKTMVESAKNIMETNSKNVYSFPPMNAADRRLVHTIAAEMGLKTQSDGEDRNRHVNLIS